MKATGIVRRIDDLGRVVIPKEIRRTLKIREGMPMEIFTDVSGEVILKKYSPVGEMAALAQAYTEALVALTGLAAAVCDGEQVIALAGPSKREALHKGISPQLEELVQGRRKFVTNGENTVAAFPGTAYRGFGRASGGGQRRPHGGSDAAERGQRPPKTQRRGFGKPAGGGDVPLPAAGSVRQKPQSLEKPGKKP